MNPKTILQRKTGQKPVFFLDKKRDRPGIFWLDSSLSFGDRGNYSFFGRNPVATLSIEREILINDCPSMSRYMLEFDRLMRQIKKYVYDQNKFVVGYFGYEAMLPFLKIDHDKIIKNFGADNFSVPLVYFSVYDSVLKMKTKKGSQIFEATNPEADNYEDIISSSPDEYLQSQPEVFETAPEIIPALSRPEYLEKIKKIKKYIYEGDIYQANFTSRFTVKSFRQPIEVYHRLREISPAPYSAYLNIADFQIISSSPERMFEKEGASIKTSPIKGTIKRGASPSEEEMRLRQLTESEKDMAELLMIVDLERNDLGKIAKTGTVKVNEIFKPEIYSSIIHLVSDISAELRDKENIVEIIKSLLPGGSISGAPKKRAVEIIQEHETVPRNIYTGSIGYFHQDRADFNIAIRTIIHKDGCYNIHAGGGIVADSKPEYEYKEMELKAAKMLKAITGENTNR